MENKKVAILRHTQNDVWKMLKGRFVLQYTKTLCDNLFSSSHTHHFIGKTPVGWKQAGDGNHHKVFSPAYIHFVDNKTAQTLVGNLVIVCMLLILLLLIKSSE